MGIDEQEAARAGNELARAELGMSTPEVLKARQAQRDRQHFAGQGGAGYGTHAAPSFDLGGFLLVAAVIAVTGLMLLVVLLLAGVWMALHDPLRSILEASPLSGSIAERPKADSNPLLVVAVTGGLVLAAMIAASVWRRGVATRVVLGEAPLRAAFLASGLRALVIFGGIAFVIVCGGIAAGADLPRGIDFPVKPPDGEASGSVGSAVVPIGLALLALGGFTWLSNGKALQKASRNASPAFVPDRGRQAV